MTSLCHSCLSSLLITWFICFSAKAINPPIDALVSFPIKLTEFKAFNYQKNKVYLEWETELEQNNKKFVVERSLDGENFSEVGQVIGVGNSTKKHLYDFVDVFPKVGRNYYRLCQFDTNEKATVVGDLCVVEIQKVVEDFIVMPNSTTEDVEVSFMAFKQGLIGIKIITPSGLTIKDFYLLGEEGFNNFQIDLSDLEKGEYTIALNDFNNDTFTDKITKTY